MKCVQVFFLVIVCVLVAVPSHGIERVYLRSGSTLIADTHKDLGEKVRVTLYSGAVISIDSSDVDKITIETSAPIDLSAMEIDPEKILPDVSDPLNEKWLDRPEPEDTEAARFFLPFEEQLARGFEVPLAKTLADVRMGRRKKVRSLEFIERTFYLGMDMQYHDDPGMTFMEAYDRMVDLEVSRNVKDVVEFLRALRGSHVDPRKEPIIAAAIELRDRLNPDFDRREINVEGWTAQASVHSLPFGPSTY